VSFAEAGHSRRVVLLQGCVQQVATPSVNAALAKLLERVGIGVHVAPAENCCGALPLHLGDGEHARAMMSGNVDALALALERNGTEAIVSTASGCGVTVKDYGRMLANDPLYAARARLVSDKAKDAGEYLRSIGFVPRAKPGIRKVAWHPPCTLQHGQRQAGAVEELLTKAGYELVPVRDRHLCCGSAGTYSVLQPEFAAELERRKLEALQEHAPDAIATANVGCELHLAKRAAVPVRHWLELID
jgi:glycolate oxidase iron-sulfur subunit